MNSAKESQGPTFNQLPEKLAVREPVRTAPIAEVWGHAGTSLETAVALPRSEALSFQEDASVRFVEFLERVLPNRKRVSRWNSRDRADKELMQVVGGGSAAELGLWSDYATDAAWARQFVQGPAAPLLTRRGDEYVVDAAHLAGVERYPGLQPLGCLAAIRFTEDGTPTPVRVRLEDGTDVRPGDGERWEIAKLVAGSAIQTWLVIGPHLIHLHYLSAGALATLVHAELPAEHSLRRLLAPHVLGTLRVNHRAGRTLLGPYGNVQTMYSFPWPMVKQVVGRAVAAFDPATFDVPQDIDRRGLREAVERGWYPYGEDALLLWEAILSYVERWVALTYPSDAALAADPHLAHLLAHAPRLLPGGLPADNVATLSRSIARLIYAVTAYHKMVGGISLEFMTHPYFMPHRTWQGTTVDEVVPWREETEANLAAKYGTTYRTYRLVNDWTYLAPDDAHRKVMIDFQAALRGVGETIDARNRARRFPFPHLHPGVLDSSVAV